MASVEEDEMKSHIIKSPRQDNGIWGTPLNLFKIENNYWDKDELLHSAIIISFSEVFPNNKFQICWQNKDGFFVKFEEEIKNKKFFNIKYNMYKLEDYMLIIFESDEERINYERHDKLSLILND